MINFLYFLRINKIIRNYSILFVDGIKILILRVEIMNNFNSWYFKFAKVIINEEQ